MYVYVCVGIAGQHGKYVHDSSFSWNTRTLVVRFFASSCFCFCFGFRELPRSEPPRELHRRNSKSPSDKIGIEKLLHLLSVCFADGISVVMSFIMAFVICSLRWNAVNHPPVVNSQHSLSSPLRNYA